MEYRTTDTKTIEEVARAHHIPDDVLEQLFPGWKNRYVVFKAGAMYKHKAVGCGEPYVLVYAGSWSLVNTVHWKAWRYPEMDAAKAFGNVDDWEFVGMASNRMRFLEQAFPSATDLLRKIIDVGPDETREWIISEIRKAVDQ